MTYCIDLVYDKLLLDEGIKHYIKHDFEKVPHILIIGATGTGKTFLVRLIIARISLYLPNVRVYVCNFKADTDFSFLKNSLRYFEFENCSDGLNQFYSAFLARQNGSDLSREFLGLVFDEFASYVNSLDKKGAEDEKRKLSTLLMLGRSFNVHVLISQQRGDAQYFNTARDNFSCVIALGNLSNEGKQMFFSDCKDQMVPVSGIGAGYMLADGARFRQIQVPYISNTVKLETFIRKAVTNE